MERNYMGAGFPAFIKTYHPELCYPKLKIPSRFLKFFNGDIPVISLLEVEGPTRRSSRVVVERIEEDFFFKGGWPNFVQDNSLEFEEFLNFSYAGNSIFYVKIYGKNGYLKQDLTAIEELELHPLDEENTHEIQVAAPLADQALDGSVNSVVSITLFEVIMRKSNFSKMMLNIPVAFGKKYMKRGKYLKRWILFRLIVKAGQLLFVVLIDLNFRKGGAAMYERMICV